MNHTNEKSYQNRSSNATDEDAIGDASSSSISSSSDLKSKKSMSTRFFKSTPKSSSSLLRTRSAAAQNSYTGCLLLCVRKCGTSVAICRILGVYYLQTPSNSIISRQSKDDIQAFTQEQNKMYQI